MTNSATKEQMRSRFEASLPSRMERASRVKLQHFIPEHWFAAAASESVSMFIDGYFYGAISVAQAYIEALSRFLAEHHSVPVRKDVEERCRRLNDSGVITIAALNAAVAIMRHRNDFHHLNKSVPADYSTLQTRAEDCINNLYTIETEIFAYSLHQPGQLVFHRPEYWPDAGVGMTSVRLRNLL